MKTARILLALCLAVPGQAASPARAIDRLLASSPAARGAFWGIQVTDLKTGRTLYQLNADRLFSTGIQYQAVYNRAGLDAPRAAIHV